MPYGRVICALWKGYVSYGRVICALCKGDMCLMGG